jgi:hypothetical protein
MSIIWYGDEIEFSTGNRAYVHDASIGLSLDGERVVYGQDGELMWTTDDEPIPYNPSPLTPVEMIELADEMIAKWQRFRDARKAELK